MALNLIAIKKLRLSEVRNPLKFHLVMIASNDLVIIFVCRCIVLETSASLPPGDRECDSLIMLIKILFTSLPPPHQELN